MTDTPKLTEGEWRVLEKLRLLKLQDPTFGQLPIVLCERFDVMLQRGRDLNGDASSVLDQIYYMKDQSAFHRAFEPLNRLKKAFAKAMWQPDEKIKDKIQDSANFDDMWLCCRKAKEKGDVA